MKKFSKFWKSSTKPRKQRNYRTRSSLHLKQKLVHSQLSKPLREKYKKRNIGLRKSDKVKIMVGKFRKHEGKVEKINLTKTEVYVSGAETTRKDGTKQLIALHPSNLMITELNTDDKLRLKILERK